MGPATATDVSDDSPDVDLDLLEYLLTLSPAERLRRHNDALELVQALRAEGRRHYGFDPGVTPPAE